MSLNRKTQLFVLRLKVTKNLFHTALRTPLPPQETRTFEQRLQAANEAWQDFIYAQEQNRDSRHDWNAMSALTTFSRFVHELVPDRHLRGCLLRHFEQQLQGTGAPSSEVVQ
jgi:hypothetical protein